MSRRKINLVCTLLAVIHPLASCMSERLAPSGQTEGSQECRQMQQKLADQALTPAQAAEITKNMEKAGCGRR